MYDVEGLLLNVLILVFFLLFVPLFLMRNLKSSSKYEQSIIVASTSLAIIACISFPINYSEGFFYDLRFVAQIIGSLYGGMVISIIYWLVVIIYRALFGGLGMYSTFIVSTFILLATLFFSTRFEIASKIKKIVLGAVFSVATSLLVVVVTMVFFQLPNINKADFYHFILQLCTTIVIIYILEVIRETSFINERIIQAEKNEIVSHLASSISHEVRNPLAVVRGFLQMMGDSNLSEEKRKEFLKISISEIDRANDIIRNYLTFAKPSFEKVEIIDIKFELERAIQIIAPLANKNSVEIRTNFDQSFIKGETQLLQQCILNITKNCIEAMPTNGKLFIGTKLKGNEVIVKIKDNGVGMTEEQLAKLGEPYFTTKGNEGTGLGMMAVIKIVELMNGKLKVESKENVGTTFQLSFPLVNNLDG